MATFNRVPVFEPIVDAKGVATPYLIKNWPKDTSAVIPPSATNQSIGVFTSLVGGDVECDTTSFEMMGLGGAWQFTPVLTTPSTVLLTASGSLRILYTFGPAGAVGVNFKLMLGTGTPPANGDAETGTQVGQTWVESFAAGFAAASGVTIDASWPFSVNGLTTVNNGDLYWVDISAQVLLATQRADFDVTQLAVQEVGIPVAV